MQNPPEKIIEKIKKCLALSKSASQHEAESALLYARNLSMKWNIDLSEISLSEKTKSITHKQFQEDGFRRSPASDAAASIIENFFHCSIFYTRYTDRIIYTIIGSPQNIEIGEYIYFFLKNEFFRLFRKYKKEHCGIHLHRRSFFDGLYAGLWQKLKAQESDLSPEIKEKYALIKCSDKNNISAYKAENWNLRAGKKRKYGLNEKSHSAGREAAKEINILGAINGPKSATGNALIAP